MGVHDYIKNMPKIKTNPLYKICIILKFLESLERHRTGTYVG